MAVKSYDFSGWATKFNIKCEDGRTIRPGAFDDDNGKEIPIVWNHQHNSPENCIGHALLERREDGMYAYGSFNDTPNGKLAKELVGHGDVKALSIYANKLTQSKQKDVIHGSIRELSLVLAGANPGALIDYPILAHGDDDFEEIYDEAIIYSGEDGTIELAHATEETEETEEDETVAEVKEEMKEEVIQHAAEEEKSDSNSEETIGDVFNTLNEKQKKAVYAMIGMALEEQKNEGNKEAEMKHNAFDNEQMDTQEYLTDEEVRQVFSDAKRYGSLKDAVLAHSIDTTGMETATGDQDYGFNDASMLFPEYKNLNNPPEWIKRDTGWVGKVLGGVHHTPFSRIRSTYANITEDEARAKGYMKGNRKKEEVFTTLKRTTDPQTIYKKQKLDRDDILDITDFDVVRWIKAEMKVMLDEEKARAILIGDGRANDSDDKISEAHIRPIAKDVPLFNVQVPVTYAEGATGAEKADAIIDQILRKRKEYKGSGTPTLFTTEDWLTEMLLLKDGIGHRLYKTEAELATAIRVKEIVTVEVMEGVQIDDKDLVGVIVNLSDYNVGADNGAAEEMFDDFDIDYNQYKYLIEGRMSGALIKPFSAMTVTIAQASSGNNEPAEPNDNVEG